MKNTVIPALVFLSLNMSCTAYAADEYWFFDKQVRVALALSPFQEALLRLQNAKYEAWFPRESCKNGFAMVRVDDDPNKPPQLAGTYWFFPADGRNGLSLRLDAKFVAKADAESGALCPKPSAAVSCDLLTRSGPTTPSLLRMDGSCVVPDDIFNILGRFSFDFRVKLPVNVIQNFKINLHDVTRPDGTWSRAEFGSWTSSGWVGTGTSKDVALDFVLGGLPDPTTTYFVPPTETSINGKTVALGLDLTAASGLHPFAATPAREDAMKQFSSAYPLWGEHDVGIAIAPTVFTTGPIGSIFPIRVSGTEIVDVLGSKRTLEYQFKVAAPRVAWSENELRLGLSVVEPEVQDVTTGPGVSVKVCEISSDIHTQLPHVDPDSGKLLVRVERFVVGIETCIGEVKVKLAPSLLQNLLDSELTVGLKVEDFVDLSLPACIDLGMPDKITAKLDCPDEPEAGRASFMTPTQNSILKLDLPHTEIRTSDGFLQIGVPILVVPAAAGEASSSQ
jgi:hypothetical protein